MALWSELPLARVEVELARLGITTRSLILDARDVPELTRALQRSGQSFEEKLRIALVWFGDDGHPQPGERTDWQITGRTRDWDRLPQLDGDVPDAVPTLPRYRAPDELLIETVLACGAKVEERLAAKTSARRVPHELTQEQIALEFRFSRDRVRQIEGLIRVGWSLGESHPDFLPKDGYVMLPSVDEAASLLASR